MKYEIGSLTTAAIEALEEDERVVVELDRFFQSYDASSLVATVTIIANELKKVPAWRLDVRGSKNYKQALTFAYMEPQDFAENTYKVKIYYYKNTLPEELQLNLMMMSRKYLDKYFESDRFDLDKNYIKVMKYTLNKDEMKEYSIEVLLEEIFQKFNSEKNPLNSEKNQNFIINNRLHTSMSLGDIIEINSDKYCVQQIGFYKI